MEAFALWTYNDDMIQRDNPKILGVSTLKQLVNISAWIVQIRILRIRESRSEIFRYWNFLSIEFSVTLFADSSMLIGI